MATFSSKIKILVKNRNFGQKSKFWSKIEILVKNRNFGQKLKIFKKCILNSPADCHCRCQKFKIILYRWRIDPPRRDGTRGRILIRPVQYSIFYKSSYGSKTFSGTNNSDFKNFQKISFSTHEPSFPKCVRFGYKLASHEL